MNYAEAFAKACYAYGCFRSNEFVEQFDITITNDDVIINPEVKKFGHPKMTLGQFCMCFNEVFADLIRYPYMCTPKCIVYSDADCNLYLLHQGCFHGVHGIKTMEDCKTTDRFDAHELSKKF